MSDPFRKSKSFLSLSHKYALKVRSPGSLERMREHDAGHMCRKIPAVMSILVIADTECGRADASPSFSGLTMRRYDLSNLRSRMSFVPPILFASGAFSCPAFLLA
jgi:hypothetical protein